MNFFGNYKDYRNLFSYRNLSGTCVSYNFNLKSPKKPVSIENFVVELSKSCSTNSVITFSITKEEEEIQKELVEFLKEISVKTLNGANNRNYYFFGRTPIYKKAYEVFEEIFKWTNRLYKSTVDLLLNRSSFSPNHLFVEGDVCSIGSRNYFVSSLNKVQNTNLLMNSYNQKVYRRTDGILCIRAPYDGERQVTRSDTILVCSEEEFWEKWLRFHPTATKPTSYVFDASDRLVL